ncbi:MAG: hypothetical protein Q8R83_06255 [Legionellaceae bacterium]|nr:hypothetical protein [Legionellaceae bacterium]
MKKLFLFILILIVISGCKSRKLNKESVSIVDKTRTEESAQVKEQVMDTKSHQETRETTISDQSGTWIWEEWYQRDLNADTIISPISKHLLYKRTTFIKNDINKTETVHVADFENHSEIKDSTVTREVLSDVHIETKTKELEAKKESGWILPLAVLLITLLVLVFIIRDLR